MPARDGFVRLTFDIPIETHRALKMIAARDGVSMISIVLKAINRELGYMTRKQQEE